jgi:hypothetical protein
MTKINKAAMRKNKKVTEAVEMCPTACCGEPVKDCKCGPDCEHCDCHAKNKARMNESENNCRVVAKSNDDDSEFKSGMKTKAAADTMAKKMKKAKRKDGAMMYNSIKVVTESKKTIREGVLDDMDDDGFMAKRQLYDLAKYAVELHRLIQDTDDLEPWVSAKITKANDYISTVKHYMEYNAVRGAEGTADQLDMEVAAMDDEPTVEMPPMEAQVFESQAQKIYKKMMSGLKGK